MAAGQQEASVPSSNISAGRRILPQKRLPFVYQFTLRCIRKGFGVPLAGRAFSGVEERSDRRQIFPPYLTSDL